MPKVSFEITEGLVEAIRIQVESKLTGGEDVTTWMTDQVAEYIAHDIRKAFALHVSTLIKNELETAIRDTVALTVRSMVAPMIHDRSQNGELRKVITRYTAEVVKSLLRNIDPEHGTPIRSAMLTPRTANALIGAGITTLEASAVMSDEELLAVPNLGARSLRELREAQKKYCKLKGDFGDNKTT